MRLLNILVLTLLFSSCGQQKPPESNSQDSKQSAIDTVLSSATNELLNIHDGDFQEIGETGVVMFPLTLPFPERKEGKLSYYKSSDYTHGYWNVLFYNTRTGETLLLSDQRMLISTFTPEVVAVKADIPDTARRNIFYEVKTDDLDKDGELADTDPEYLYMSDMDGSNFRQVSPPGFNLRSWKRFKSSHTLIMLVAKDSNKDGVYDLNDEELIFTVDISQGGPPSEILSGDLKLKIRRLFERDWKK